MKRTFHSYQPDELITIFPNTSVSALSMAMERRSCEESFVRHIAQKSELYHSTQNDEKALGYFWYGRTCKKGDGRVSEPHVVPSKKVDVVRNRGYLEPVSLARLLGEERDDRPFAYLDDLFSGPSELASSDLPSGPDGSVATEKDAAWNLEELESNILEDAEGREGDVKIRAISTCSKMGPCFRVICRQVSSFGGREYAAVWMPEFLDRAFSSSDPSLSTFNELVPSRIPCKLYLDLDLKLTPAAQGDRVWRARWLSALERVRSGLHSFCCYVACRLRSDFALGDGEYRSSSSDAFVSWTVLDASSLEKISKHVVFNVCGNRCLFKNKSHVANYLRHCVGEWKRWIEREHDEQTKLSMSPQEKYSWNREAKKRENPGEFVEVPTEQAADSDGSNILCKEIPGVGNPQLWSLKDSAAVIEANLDWEIYAGEKEFRMMGSTKFGEVRHLELESVGKVIADFPKMDRAMENLSKIRGNLATKGLIHLDGLVKMQNHLRFSVDGTKRSWEVFIGPSLMSSRDSKASNFDETINHYDDESIDDDDDGGGVRPGQQSSDLSPEVATNVDEKPPAVDLKIEALLSLVVPFFVHDSSLLNVPLGNSRYDFSFPNSVKVLSFGNVSDSLSLDDPYLRRKSILQKMTGGDVPEATLRSNPKRRKVSSSASTAEAFYSSSYYNTRPYGKELLEALPSWVSSLKEEDDRNDGDAGNISSDGVLTLSKLREKFLELGREEKRTADDLHVDEMTLKNMVQRGDDPLGTRLFRDIGDNITRKLGEAAFGHRVFYKCERRTPDGFRWLIYNTSHKYKMCYVKGMRDGPENAKHTNNNVFFVVCLNNFTFYQKCHSQECSNFYHNSFVLQKPTGSEAGQLEKNASGEEKGREDEDEEEGEKERFSKVGEDSSRARYARGPVKLLDEELWSPIMSFLQFDDMLDRWNAYDCARRSAV